MEEAREEETRLSERRERVYASYQDGVIFKGEDDQEVVEILRKAKDQDLRKWEGIIDQAERDQIDADEAAQVQATVRDFMVKPDDPSYNFIYDQDLRKRIEADLKPIDFGMMIFDGFADQEITLRKGLTVTYRTINTQHALWLERRLHEAAKLAEQYGRHWFSTLQLAISVQKINGKEIGADLSSFDEEALVDKFWEALAPRIKRISRLPTEITDLLIANMAWFSGRVRKELVGDLTEKVGNS
jgi:hypothetical protein